MTRGFAAALALVPVLLPDASFVSHGGVRIRYVEQGQGTPVVLIHGYTGTVERHWIDPGVFAELAKDHRVIAFDCRGHGGSDKPHDPRGYGAAMGQDVMRLLDHLEIPRAHIVGYSMGAIIAGDLLTTNPDRFIGAALVGRGLLRTWTAADEQEAEASARELEGDTPFRSLILALRPPGSPLPGEQEIRKLAQPLVAVNDLKALAAFHRGRLRGRRVVTEQELAAVRVPTLGIIGSADRNLASMRDLEKIMPTLRVVVVEGAEHGGERGILRRPEFMAALHEFLDARR